MKYVDKKCAVFLARPAWDVKGKRAERKLEKAYVEELEKQEHLMQENAERQEWVTRIREALAKKKQEREEAKKKEGQDEGKERRNERLWLWWLKKDTEASRNGKRFRASQWQTLSAR